MDVVEDLLDDVRLIDCCNHPQLATALRTQLNVQFENSFESFCPGKRGEGKIGLC